MLRSPTQPSRHAAGLVSILLALLALLALLLPASTASARATSQATVAAAAAASTPTAVDRRASWASRFGHQWQRHANHRDWRWLRSHWSKGGDKYNKFKYYRPRIKRWAPFRITDCDVYEHHVGSCYMGGQGIQLDLTKTAHGPRWNYLWAPD